jgi:hypothetical protein
MPSKAVAGTGGDRKRKGRARPLIFVGPQAAVMIFYDRAAEGIQEGWRYGCEYAAALW